MHDTPAVATGNAGIATVSAVGAAVFARIARSVEIDAVAGAVVSLRRIGAEALANRQTSRKGVSRGTR